MNKFNLLIAWSFFFSLRRYVLKCLVSVLLLYMCFFLFLFHHCNFAVGMNSFMFGFNIWLFLLLLKKSLGMDIVFSKAEAYWLSKVSVSSLIGFLFFIYTWISTYAFDQCSSCAALLFIVRGYICVLFEKCYTHTQ